MSGTNHSGRFSEADVDNVRRGFSNDHGRYIALMDLSHFLSSDTVEGLLPANEVVLPRPLPGPLNPSMVELPSTSRNLDFQDLAPPAPPLPRMMKNLLKDRRRFQRQFVPAPSPVTPDFDGEVIAAAHRAMENYQLAELFRNEMRNKKPKRTKAFCRSLLLGTMMEKDCWKENKDENL